MNGKHLQQLKQVLRLPLVTESRNGWWVKVTWAIFAFYALFQLYVYTRNSYVPDERLFVSYMLSTGPHLPGMMFHPRDWLLYIFNYDNGAGYGSAYWLFSLFILKIGIWSPIGGPHLLRCIALFAMLLPLWLAIRNASAKSSVAGAAVMLLWLACPFAWWYGKLISPEPFVFALSALILALSFSFPSDNRIRIAFFLSGFAAGIKLIALPIAFYVALRFAIMMPRSRWLSMAGKGIALAAVGFVAANPFLLRHPQLYLKNLAAVSQVNQHGILDNVRATTFRGWTTTWDLIETAGFFSELWGFVPFFAICALLFLLLPRKHFLILGTSLLFALMMLSLNAFSYGWYMMPAAALLLFSFSEACWQTAGDLILTGLLVVLALIWNGPHNFSSISNKFEQVRNLEATDQVIQCLSNFKTTFSASRHLYDLSEVAIRGRQTGIAGGLTESLQEKGLISGDLQVRDGYEAYVAFDKAFPTAADGSSMLLIGDRFRNAPPGSLRHYFSAGNDPGLGRYIGRCRHISIYQL